MPIRRAQQIMPFRKGQQITLEEASRALLERPTHNALSKSQQTMPTRRAQQIMPFRKGQQITLEEASRALLERPGDDVVPKGHQRMHANPIDFNISHFTAPFNHGHT
jgi:hypothetical protein